MFFSEVAFRKKLLKLFPPNLRFAHLVVYNSGGVKSDSVDK